MLDDGLLRVAVGKEHGLLRVVGEQAVLLILAEGQELDGHVLSAVGVGLFGELPQQGLYGEGAGILVALDAVGEDGGGQRGEAQGFPELFHSEFSLI